MSISKLLSTFKDASKKHGLRYVMKKSISVSFSFIYYKFFRYGKTFNFRGKKYRYNYSMYNTTWMNERSVEIPLALDILKKNEGKNILEIGNVTSNYYDIPHVVIDKYEKGSNIINQDVIDFDSKTKYDLIISISTLEHVGWDEIPRDDKKIPLAIENLKKLLKPKTGLLFVTVPFGYNTVLDQIMKEEKIKFHEKYYLRRISRNNEWIESSWEEVQNTKFGIPFSGANGLIVGIINS